MIFSELNKTAATGCLFSQNHSDCSHEKLIPLWYPSPLEMTPVVRFGRAIVLVIGLAYLFLGISIIVDKLVEAFDSITSHKRRVRVVSPTTGHEEFIHEPVWNATVAHLAVAVIGSTAPEITLASVDVFAQNFTLGTLGPSVIVGSGAFNFFLVTAICMVSVKKGEVRRVKEMPIFFVTATFAIFSYVWLFLIIEVMSPTVVDLWEALLTLFFFPTAVLVGYLTNKRCFGFCAHLATKIRRQSGTVTPSAVSFENENGRSNNNNQRRESVIDLVNSHQHVDSSEADETSDNDTQKVIEHAERRFVEIEAELRQKHPEIPSDKVKELAELELVNELPKSLAFYRAQATRRMVGAEDIITRKNLRKAITRTLKSRKDSSDYFPVQTVSFETNAYSSVKAAGSVALKIIRQGQDLFDNEISVGICTEDGTAKSGTHYRHTQDRIYFKGGENVKTFEIEVFDEEDLGQDIMFYVHLTDPRFVEPLELAGMASAASSRVQVNLSSNSRIAVLKLAKNHSGLFHLTTDTVTVEENVGELTVKVMRSAGGKGRVVVPVNIEPLTAKVGEHYENSVNMPSEIYFDSKQIEGFVKIKIIDQGKLDKNVTLRVMLGEPFWTDGTNSDDDELLAEAPRLGQPSTLLVTIVESSKLKRIVDDIATMDVYDDLVVANMTWQEQLRAAFRVSSSNGDDDDDDDDNDNDVPKWRTYLLHGLAIFWKFLVALTPPTSLWHGWPAGLTCLVLMAFVTILIDDLSIQLGCTLGLSDELTAITFVSLGVGLPDIFASTMAARREETADAAIGHICGTSVANVFLGLGLAWSVAAIYQTIDGKKLTIQPGSLGFSVTLYFIFAVGAIAFLMVRRLISSIGGELGGPTLSRIASSLIFLGLWLIYVCLSALDNYCVMTTY